MDAPERQPVVIHCAGGRHRTGSMSALFRLEYDRWPIDRVLAEMYSYKFGPPVALHEHNLRTYLPRPRPTAEQLEALRTGLSALLQGDSNLEYEAIVRQLRAARSTGNSNVDDVLANYLQGNQPFALPLAARLIDDPSDSLIAAALPRAVAALEHDDASSDDWSTAAAFVADFGLPEQQLALLRLLTDEQQSPTPSNRYRAVAAGVTNRYTSNRIPYLAPLLEDERQRAEPEAAGYRYCDTAAARLSVIVSQNFLATASSPTDTAGWQRAVAEARAWFKDYAGEAQLGPLVPPAGRNEVRHVEANDGTYEMRD
jgi:hypothetical protein